MRVVSVLNKLFCRDFVYDSGKLYFAAYNLNGVFSFEFDKGICKLLTYIPKEIVSSGNGYYSAINLFKKKLFIAPDCANSLLVYDIVLDKLKKISMPKTRVFYPYYSKFYSVIPYNNHILFIPCRFPGIIESDEWGNNISLHECNILQDKNILVVDACVVQDEVYMITWNSKQVNMTGNVLVFNMNRKKFSIMDICAAMKIYSICYEQPNLWLMTDKGLLKYCLTNLESIQYGMPKIFSMKQQTYQIIFFESKIWIFAESGEAFCVFDIKKERYEFEEQVTNRDCYQYIKNNYVSVKVYDSKLFYFNASAGRLFVFCEGNREEYDFAIPNNYDRNMFIPKDVDMVDIFDEGKDLPIFGYHYELTDLLQIIYSSSKHQSKKSSSGKRIYEEIRKFI